MDELLVKEKVGKHSSNKSLVSTEFFKVKNWVSTRLTEDNFQFVNNFYNLPNNRIL